MKIEANNLAQSADGKNDDSTQRANGKKKRQPEEDLAVKAEKSKPNEITSSADKLDKKEGSASKNQAKTGFMEESLINVGEKWLEA